MYKIMWNGGYGTEEVDTADTLDEANRLVGEYNMAYGGGVWKVRGRGGD
jgi:hypothetical protein